MNLEQKDNMGKLIYNSKLTITIKTFTFLNRTLTLDCCGLVDTKFLYLKITIQICIFRHYHYIIYSDCL